MMLECMARLGVKRKYPRYPYFEGSVFLEVWWSGVVVFYLDEGRL